ncbi:hypothetical protein GWK47_036897 [Chionoecetes opilio]|uniref:Uncharacterized protein n=1 Tax=Chionoecetes opilio TaxID=41210 RepID=A0A8J5D2I5_CHIOP|nr:hypothetical protein GWK47_036897 [Chionoecetes opilio]
MQCVGAMIQLLATSEEDPGNATTANTKPPPGSEAPGTPQAMAAPLAEVVTHLNQHIPDLIPFFREEFLMTLYQVFSPASVLQKMPETLRQPLVESFCLCVASLSPASPHLPQATSVLEGCVDQNILVPEARS